MSTWSKGSVGTYNHDAATEADQALAAELTGGEKRVKIELKKGLNVLLWVPQIGTMTKPYRYVPLHYRPFHVCGRHDSTDNPEKPGEFIEDNRFSNCVRCQTAWNIWDKAGRPAGPLKGKFREDMSNFRCAIQAVNLTPFFKLDSTGEFAQPDLAKLKKYGAAFVQILGGGEVPEGTPEDIVEAAKPGVDILWLNKDTAKELRKIHVRQSVKAKGDPLHSPEEYLLTFNKQFDKEFDLPGGKKGQGYKYNPSFTDKDMMDGFKLPKGLIDVVEEQMVDLNNPPVDAAGDEPTLEERVAALARLPNDALAEYLEASGHSYHIEVEGIEGDDQDLADPDQFETVSEDSVLGTGGKANLNALRAQISQSDEE